MTHKTTKKSEKTFVLDLQDNKYRENIFANRFDWELHGGFFVSYFAFERGGRLAPSVHGVALGLQQIRSQQASLTDYFAQCTGEGVAGAPAIEFDVGSELQYVTTADYVQVSRSGPTAELAFRGFSMASLAGKEVKARDEKSSTLSTSAELKVRCPLELQIEWLYRLLEALKKNEHTL